MRILHDATDDMTVLLGCHELTISEPVTDY
jgi:hypothetical protein